MKRLLLSIVLFAIYTISLAQESDLAKSYMLDRIKFLMSQKEYHQAYTEYSTFINQQPKYQDKDSYFLLGNIRWLLNDPIGRIEDFKVSRNLGYDKITANATYSLFNGIEITREKKETIIKQAKTIQWFLDDSVRAHVYSHADTLGLTLNPNKNYRPDYTRKDSLKGALRDERTCFDVKYYNLDVRINTKKKFIEGFSEIFFDVIENTNRIQIDLFENMVIDSIIFKNKPLKFTREYNAVFVEFSDKLLKKSKETIRVYYHGNPIEAIDPPWLNGFVWKEGVGYMDWVGVACEHTGASLWWPNKDHLSDKPDSMEIHVEVPKGHMGIANGNLVSLEKGLKKYERYNWKVSYPINNYNATIYVGNFVNFNEKIGDPRNPLVIDYYVLPHNLRKAKDFYSNTRSFIEFLEDIFGPYPFKKDGLAFIEAPYMGMEHQSAIAIGDIYDKRNIENINYRDGYLTLLHETAHEWWGNALAVNDAVDSWISEGFATYTELLYAESNHSKKEYYQLLTTKMKDITNIWPMVGNRDVNENSYWGSDIYTKGAMMLHNLRCMIDDDQKFFKLIKEFYNTYKFKTAKTEDFTTFIHHKTNKDFSAFFNTFLYKKTPPTLQYNFSIIDSTLNLSYKWINVDENFKMPFAICVNKDKCIKINATTEEQLESFEEVGHFYIPTPYNYDIETIPENSFLYFTTNWIEDDYKIITLPGNMEARGYSRDRIKIGKWDLYRNNRLIKTSRYASGARQGIEETFDNNKLKSVTSYTNGNKNGSYVVYEEETKIIEGNYSNGSKTGEWIYKFANGQIQAAGKYSENKKNGKWKYFNESNQCIAEGEFKEGFPIESTWKYNNSKGVVFSNPMLAEGVSHPPFYIPGETELFKAIYKNLQLDDSVFEKHEGEKIYISFQIHPNGMISDYKIEQSCNEGIANLLISALKGMDEWSPGYNQGNPVISKYYLPFKISQEDYDIYNYMIEI